MKKYLLDFCRRGLIACGFGPLVLGVFYLVLKNHAGIETITVNQACTGIFSLSALSFVAGGMNVIYQIERLPLILAILAHGGVLYTSYLVTYLLNGWLEEGVTPILVFSGFFLLGYLLVWAIIYCITQKKTESINEVLKKKQQGLVDIKPE